MVFEIHICVSQIHICVLKIHICGFENTHLWFLKYTFVFCKYTFVFCKYTFVFCKCTFLVFEIHICILKYTFVFSKYTFVFLFVCLAKLNGIERLFFPRLGAMTLDTVERVKYFGLRGNHACGCCRLRNGRSATRRSTRHDPEIIHLYFQWATRECHTRERISQRSKARSTLLRHGFQYKKRCRLRDFATHCLVDVPELPRSLFAGLCEYERLHTFFIAYCQYLTDSLAACVLSHMRSKIVEHVKSCHNFRDPITGRAHPRLQTILKMTHLTGERRVRSIFYWAHALGTTAEVLVEPVRVQALVAVSTLQLLLIATRNHRPYTRVELEEIFHNVGREFFTSLEFLSSYAEDKRMEKGEEAHRRRPDQVRPPVPFKRMRRCVCTNNQVYFKTKI